jgi:Tol biopolymer transport system component
MSHLFISYSKQDIRFARHLRGLLQDEGFAVWMDETKIAASQRWWPTIESNIKSCAAFIVIMSSNSLESEWVEREILVAERKANRKPIFPVLLDGEVWGRLGNLQYEDMTAGTTTKLTPAFVETLKSVAPTNSGVAAPPPLPADPITSTVPQVPPTRKTAPVTLTIGVAALAIIVVGTVFFMSRNGNAALSAPTPNTSELTASAIVTIQPTSNTEVTKVSASQVDATESPFMQTEPALIAVASTSNGSGKIAFTSERDGNREIYVMNADGSKPVNITKNAARSDWSPAWSPDGNRIAYTSELEDNNEIYLMNADGSNMTRLTKSANDDYWPVWSPDGSRIAFTSKRDGNAEIYVMNADGTNPVNISNNANDDLYPAWSPDGNRIAFVSNRDGNAEIYVMNADGANPVNISNDEDHDYFPGWSPDSSKIVFQSKRNGLDQIYVMNADGSNVIRLTTNQFRDFEPEWSPDGSKILFNSNRDGKDDIYIMDANGANPVRLTKNTEEDLYPSWQPLPKP